VPILGPPCIRRQFWGHPVYARPYNGRLAHYDYCSETWPWNFWLGLQPSGLTPYSLTNSIKTLVCWFIESTQSAPNNGVDIYVLLLFAKIRFLNWPIRWQHYRVVRLAIFVGELFSKLCVCVFVIVDVCIQSGPKKVSHYRESSLNRIENRKPSKIFHQFWL